MDVADFTMNNVSMSPKQFGTMRLEVGLPLSNRFMMLLTA